MEIKLIKEKLTTVTEIISLNDFVKNELETLRYDTENQNVYLYSDLNKYTDEYHSQVIMSFPISIFEFEHFLQDIHESSTLRSALISVKKNIFLLKRLIF